jgi:hypothetical protein
MLVANCSNAGHSCVFLENGVFSRKARRCLAMPLKMPRYYRTVLDEFRTAASADVLREILRRRCFAWLYRDRDEESGELLESTCSQDGDRGGLCPIRDACKMGFLVAEERHRRPSRTGRPLELAARVEANAGELPPVAPISKPMKVEKTRSFDVLNAFLEALGKPPIVTTPWTWEPGKLLEAMHLYGPVVFVAPASYHTLICWVPSGPASGQYEKVVRVWTDWRRSLRLDLVPAAAHAARDAGLWLEALPRGVAAKFKGATARLFLHRANEARLLAKAILDRYGYAREEIAAWGKEVREENVA